MSNRFRDDIRRIAETEELKKAIKPVKDRTDKKPIERTRGVGISEVPFDPCKTLYSQDDGIYSMAGLIDGTEGPQIVDGEYNKCQQINTITGSYDLVDTSLNAVLKPDGVFLPATKYYASYRVMSTCAFFGDFTTLPFLDSVHGWWYTSKEDAFNAGCEAMEYFYDSIGDTVTFTTSSVVQEPLTEDYILDILYDSFEERYVYKENTLTTSTVIYVSATSVSGDDIGFTESWDVVREFNDTLDYFILIDDPTTAYFMLPGRQVPGIDGWGNTLVTGGLDDYYPGFQLAIDRNNTFLWFPQPNTSAAPTKYRLGASVLKMGFGVGRVGNIVPAKDGGFILYETVADVPTGFARVFRADRTLSTVVPVAQLPIYTV